MAFLGQIAFSLYFWLQYTGVQQTNASISSILVVGLIPGYNPIKWWSNISSPCEDALAIVWVPLGREAVECEDARVVLVVYKEAEPLCN
jgi:hypothetical protein